MVSLFLKKKKTARKRLIHLLFRNHLSKPANTLFRHNLTGILETAVRSSNAQYDDPEVLNRLDVRLLEVRTHRIYCGNI